MIVLLLCSTAAMMVSAIGLPTGQSRYWRHSYNTQTYTPVLQSCRLSAYRPASPGTGGTATTTHRHIHLYFNHVGYRPTDRPVPVLEAELQQHTDIYTCTSIMSAIGLPTGQSRYWRQSYNTHRHIHLYFNHVGYRPTDRPVPVLEAQLQHTQTYTPVLQSCRLSAYRPASPGTGGTATTTHRHIHLYFNHVGYRPTDRPVPVLEAELQQHTDIYTCTSIMSAIGLPTGQSRYWRHSYNNTQTYTPVLQSCRLSASDRPVPVLEAQLQQHTDIYTCTSIMSAIGLPTGQSRYWRQSYNNTQTYTPVLQSCRLSAYRPASPGTGGTATTTHRHIHLYFNHVGYRPTDRPVPVLEAQLQQHTDIYTCTSIMSAIGLPTGQSRYWRHSYNNTQTYTPVLQSCRLSAYRPASPGTGGTATTTHRHIHLYFNHVGYRPTDRPVPVLEAELQHTDIYTCTSIMSAIGLPTGQSRYWRHSYNNTQTYTPVLQSCRLSAYRPASPGTGGTATTTHTDIYTCTSIMSAIGLPTGQSRYWRHSYNNTQTYTPVLQSCRLSAYRPASPGTGGTATTTHRHIHLYFNHVGYRPTDRPVPVLEAQLQHTDIYTCTSIMSAIGLPTGQSRYWRHSYNNTQTYTPVLQSCRLSAYRPASPGTGGTATTTHTDIYTCTSIMSAIGLPTGQSRYWRQSYNNTQTYTPVLQSCRLSAYRPASPGTGGRATTTHRHIHLYFNHVGYRPTDRPVPVLEAQLQQHTDIYTCTSIMSAIGLPTGQSRYWRHSYNNTQTYTPVLQSCRLSAYRPASPGTGGTATTTTHRHIHLYFNHVGYRPTDRPVPVLEAELQTHTDIYTCTSIMSAIGLPTGQSRYWRHSYNNTQTYTPVLQSCRLSAYRPASPGTGGRATTTHRHIHLYFNHVGYRPTDRPVPVLEAQLQQHTDIYTCTSIMSAIGLPTGQSRYWRHSYNNTQTYTPVLQSCRLSAYRPASPGTGGTATTTHRHIHLYFNHVGYRPTDRPVPVLEAQLQQHTDIYTCTSIMSAIGLPTGQSRYWRHSYNTQTYTPVLQSCRLSAYRPASPGTGGTATTTHRHIHLYFNHVGYRPTDRPVPVLEAQLQQQHTDIYTCTSIMSAIGLPTGQSRYWRHSYNNTQTYTPVLQSCRLSAYRPASPGTGGTATTTHRHIHLYFNHVGYRPTDRPVPVLEAELQQHTDIYTCTSIMSAIGLPTGQSRYWRHSYNNTQTYTPVLQSCRLSAYRPASPGTGGTATTHRHIHLYFNHVGYRPTDRPVPVLEAQLQQHTDIYTCTSIMSAIGLPTGQSRYWRQSYNNTQTYTPVLQSCRLSAYRPASPGTGGRATTTHRHIHLYFNHVGYRQVERATVIRDEAAKLCIRLHYTVNVLLHCPTLCGRNAFIIY